MATRKPLVPTKFRLGDRDVATWAAEITRAAPLTRVVNITPSSVGATSESTQTFTVSGLRPADIIVACKPPSLTASIMLDHFDVSADDTLRIRFYNRSGGSLSPASGDYTLVIMR